MAAVFTDANFDADVLKAEQLTVVDFWAPWCGPCLAIGPTIESLAKDYDGKVKVGKLNVDENPNVSMEYGITSIPCVLFIKDGQVVDKQLGAAPRNVFEKKIQQHMQFSFGSIDIAAPGILPGAVCFSAYSQY